MTHVYCHHLMTLGFLHSQEAKDSAQDISYRRFSETRLGPRQAEAEHAIKMMCVADLEFQHVATHVDSAVSGLLQPMVNPQRRVM